jgi:hypothetical protein
VYYNSYMEQNTSQEAGISPVFNKLPEFYGIFQYSASLNITNIVYVCYAFWHDHIIAGASEIICGQCTALMLFIRTLMYVCT